MGQLTQFAMCVKEITVLHHEAYVSTVKGMQQTKKKPSEDKSSGCSWPAASNTSLTVVQIIQADLPYYLPRFL